MKEEQKTKKKTNKYGVTAATKRTKNIRQKKFIFWLAIRRYVQEYKIQINTYKTLFVLYCFAGKHTHIQHTYICM